MTMVDAPPADGGATDPLVCRKCTFDNRGAASADQRLPAPSACAVCLSPLEVFYAPRPERHELRGDTTVEQTSYGVITPADFPPAEVAAGGNAIAKQCPVCTVLVQDTSGSICPVCSASLAPSGGASNVRLECVVCTLCNDYGVTVCSACETPLGERGTSGGGMLVHDESGMLRFAATGRAASPSNAGISIATSTELASRTTEEGGDEQAATPGLIPKIQQRLLQEHRNLVRGGGGRGTGERTGATLTSSAAGRRREPSDWIVSGGARGCGSSDAGGRRGEKGAEWRLCAPGTMHCTQRGSAGSGFSCGYRNIQMLCSALMEWPEYRRVLFGGSGCIPGIVLLQSWIERAWADGYDPEGCEQLGGPGSLVGSDKWIGSTECATLLRSFGVRAEVVDFEMKASVGARKLATDVSAGQEQHGSTNKRKAADSPPPSPDKRSRKAPMVPIQQSIRYFLSSPRAIPEGRALGSENSGADSGDALRSNVAGATGVRGRVRHTSATGLGLEHEQAVGDEGRVGLRISNSGDGNTPVVLSIENTTRSPSLFFTGGTGNGAENRPSNNARFPPSRGTRGGRRGRGSAGRGRRGDGNGTAAKYAENGMGQAVVEWVWEYFGKPWGTVEELSGCTPGPLVPVQSRESQAPAESDGGVRSGSTSQGRLLVPTVDLSSNTAALSRDHSNVSLDDLTKRGQASLRCGRDGGQGQTGATEAQSAERGSAIYDAVGGRRPPPLYFQHDGHSRSVVGAVYGDASRKSRGNVIDGGGEGDGGARGGGERGRRSLLVFDPSQAGKDVREALDNTQNMRWGSFLKRGQHTLQRSQFQLVYIRPGLFEKRQADRWKKIVSQKVFVS